MRNVLLLALLLSAPLAPARAEDGAPPAAAAKAPWLWLHYLAADNDLEQPALDDLVEILEQQGAPGVRVLALVDRHASGEPEGGYVNGPVGPLPDFTDTRLFELRGGKAELLATWDEANTGDPAVLERFVREGLARVPAERVALVLADHGMGWPGACSDEASDGDSLTLPEIHGALRSALGEGRRLDLLCFDACVMAMLEVADAMAPVARTLVASEELEPGTGYDYREVFRRLAATLPGDGPTLGRLLVDGYRDSYEKSADPEQRKEAKGVTLSAIDLDQVAEASRAAHALGDALGAALAAGGRAAWLPIARARAESEQYGLEGALGEAEMGLRDLAHFADGVARALPGSPAAAAAARLRAALPACTLAALRGSARPNAAGLSVFLPADAAAYAADEGTSYRDLPFGAGGWRTFLESFLRVEATDAEAPRPGAPSASATSLEGEATLTLRATAEADDLEEALFFVGTRGEDGRITVVGTEPTELGEDGALSTTWDGGWFAIAEGEQGFVTPVHAYDEIEGSEDVYAVEVRVAWQRGDRPARIAHLFFELSLADEDASGTLVYAFRDTPFGAREIDLQAGDVLRPLRLTLAADGSWDEAPSTDDDEALRLTDPDALGIDYVRLDDGSWVIGFLLRDLAGNLGAEATEVTLK